MKINQFLIVLIALAMLAGFNPLAAQQDSSRSVKEIYVDQIIHHPKFGDGNVNDFRDWVQKNVNYPPVERQYGVEGFVAVEFNISDKGKITDATILRGVTPDIDAEVLRVVLSSLEWLPAREDNKWIP